MGRSSVRAAAVVTLAALFTGTATASFGAVPGGGEEPHPDRRALRPLHRHAQGCAPGDLRRRRDRHRATKPAKGKQLDAHSANSQKYVAHLKKEQQAVADAAGVTPAVTYQVTLNGFSADLDAAQVAKLSRRQERAGRVPRRDPSPERGRALHRVPRPRLRRRRHRRSVGCRRRRRRGRQGCRRGRGRHRHRAGEPARSRATSSRGKAGAAPYVAGTRSSSPRPTATSTAPVACGGGPGLDEGSLQHQARSARSTSPTARRLPDSTSTTTSCRPVTATATARTPRAPRPATSASPHRSRASTSARSRASRPRPRSRRTRPATSAPTTSSRTDDICALSDLLGAIDTAVADGVDVINYSIGGGSATTVLGPEDISFFNAAAAGVFVAVSAGNDGPGASTADHASPWYTTVAASTIPTYEGTVQLPNGFQAVGASVTRALRRRASPVRSCTRATSPQAGAAPHEAALCFLGTLDPAKVAGKIVVCDRGTNARVEKSQAVAAGRRHGHDPRQRHAGLARQRLPLGADRAHRRAVPHGAARLRAQDGRGHRDARR